MMNYILVGEKFATFANQENVTTPLVLSAAIEDGTIDACRLIRGQGVSDAWMTHLREMSERRGVSVEFSDDGYRPNRASSHSCHKLKRQNVLISEPAVIGNDTFGSQLLIDEDCELMGDHQTGHHLQGMLLIEAARQMFLAVIERYLRPKKKNYAVINHMNTAFQAFAFPLGTEIELRLKSRKENRPDRGAYDVEVAFIQNDQIVTTIDTCFTVFDAETLAPKEAGMAQDRTQAFIDMADMEEALVG